MIKPIDDYSLDDLLNAVRQKANNAQQHDHELVERLRDEVAFLEKEIATLREHNRLLVARNLQLNVRSNPV